MKNFLEKLTTILKKDPRFVDQEGELLKSEVIDKAYKIDKGLIGLLLEDKEITKQFFSEIKKHWIFDINNFVAYIQDKNFLNDSYTNYKNKIGLNIGEKFLNERKEVSLVWPFKDCILEGGMTKEDQKRKEIFFNEILAHDEIDKLLAPKVFMNWKRFVKNGEEKVEKIKRDENGIIRENLIIKGNNLLALHSLKKQFQGKIKLIYIDPPYNIGNDSFGYNDNFNHSTWLTFMKNRLEVSKDLLRDDGSIFVHLDHHELGYTNILMDEVFGSENKVQIISVKTASPAGFKTVNPGPIDVTEYILFYTKSKKNFGFKKQYVPVDYNANYNLFLKRSTDIKKWEFIPLGEKVLEINNFKNQAEARKKYGNNWASMQKALIAQFAFENADNVVSIRDPHKPTQKVQELMEKSKHNGDKVIEHKREDETYAYFYKGGSLAFYSKKIMEIDGEKVVTELLTDFWSHISWAGIAKEGGVKLKNGKKPEKLLKQIVDLATEQGDIVLDYHAGSGTTCAVAHKTGRQFIGIEQLNYEENNPEARLQNVINGDLTGISKAVSWKGGGNFIYCELAKYNEKFIDEIEKAKNTKDLLKIWEEMKKKSFLEYNVDLKKINESIQEFKSFSVAKQKRILFGMLNKNQLYVNLSEIEDKNFEIRKEDKEINKKFYKI
jgi:adenine-specific DNA-methyltransferase